MGEGGGREGEEVKATDTVKGENKRTIYTKIKKGGGRVERFRTRKNIPKDLKEGGGRGGGGGGGGGGGVFGFFCAVGDFFKHPAHIIGENLGKIKNIVIITVIVFCKK